MSSTVTIDFSRAGVKAPVFITTNLSDSKWEVLEMAAQEKTTDHSDQIFSVTFKDVKDGDYQYKFRIGYHEWVTDPSKEEVSDPNGNTNNAISVHAPAHPDSDSSGSDADINEYPTLRDDLIGTPKMLASDSILSVTGSFQISRLSATSSVTDITWGDEQKKRESSDYEDQHDTDDGQNSEAKDDPAAAPVPFTVVEKAPDVVAPSYGHVEPKSLKEDPSKRASDATPDAEYPGSPPIDSPHENLLSSIEIPRLIVERTDDEPSFGDDFGAEATSGQKVAHELRAADATPDETRISPIGSPVSEHALEFPHETDPDDAVVDPSEAPAFGHEVFESDDETDGPLLPHENPEILVDIAESPPLEGYKPTARNLTFSHEIFGNKPDLEGVASFGTEDTTSSVPEYMARHIPPYSEGEPEWVGEISDTGIPDYPMPVIEEGPDSDSIGANGHQSTNNIADVSAAGEHSGRTTPASKYVAPPDRISVAAPAPEKTGNSVSICLYKAFVLPFVFCFSAFLGTPTRRRNTALALLSILVATIAYFLVPRT